MFVGTSETLALAGGNFAKGNNSKGYKDLAIKAASFGVETIIDVKMPVETDKAANTLFKFGTGEVIDRTKKNQEKGHNN
jgi:hypothetical protein